MSIIFPMERNSVPVPKSAGTALSLYQHIKLYTKNDVTLYWEKMVLGKN